MKDTSDFHEEQSVAIDVRPTTHTVLPSEIGEFSVIEELDKETAHGFVQNNRTMDKEMLVHLEHI